MRSPNPTLNNISNLIKECEDHIVLMEKYSSEEPSARACVDLAGSRITSLRNEWININERISTSGIDDEGEYSYAILSYKASYAFVILAKYLKEFRFELEKLELYDDYQKFCG